MQQDFYTVEGLATQLLSSAFNNLNNIPDYRLRPMLRILPSPSQASLGGSEDIDLHPALFSVWLRQRRVIEEADKQGYTWYGWGVMLGGHEQNEQCVGSE